MAVVPSCHFVHFTLPYRPRSLDDDSQGMSLFQQAESVWCALPVQVMKLLSPLTGRPQVAMEQYRQPSMKTGMLVRLRENP